MAKMSTIKRESSRLSSSKNSSIAPEKPHGRPSLISRAYNTVSYRGDRGSGNRLGKVATNTSEATLGEGAGSKDLKSFNGVFPIPEPECKPGSPPKLNEEQEKKYKEMLEYFSRIEDLPVSLHADNTKREAVSEWEKLRMLSRESLLRYLRATRWDVTAAKKRLTDTIAWHREFGVDKLDPDEMAKEAQSGKETVLGYDNMSRPLHYMHPHRNDTKESPRQMQFAVWILERCIDLMPPGTEQLALLINFDHKSRNPTSIANAKLMLYILQNHYVERLGIALCINVPWVFKMFWNAIQPFIDPVTKSKCKFDEAIKTEVPVSQLSSEFGGELDAKYNHDKYWPDLVKLSDERRKEMIRRFKEDCNSEIGASEWVIRGGDDETSPFNKSSTKVAAPSEMTTTSRSSDMGPSSDPQGGEKAREAAIVASDKRRAEGTTPMYEEPMTPLERFQTPSDTLNKNPLDRQFSTTSSEGQISAPAAAAAAPALETTTEKPEEEAKTDSKQQSRPSSASNGWHHFEEEMSKGFKDFNHKLQGAFSASHSRRSSRERELSADGKTKKKRESSKLRDMAVEDDRRENVENGQEASQGIGSKIPSAQEAAAVAGAAGVTAAAGAVGSQSTGQIAEEDVKAATVSSTAADAGKNKEDDDNDGSNTIHVLYFAAAKEAAGTGRQEVELPVSPSPFPLSELGAYLSKTISDAGKGDAKAFESVLQRSRWSVNEDMIDEEEISKLTLKGGEDVAIIPPVSGG